MVDLRTKVWGHTCEVFHNTSCSVHYLEIKRGGQCSEHRHAKKTNVFFIESGTLEITEWVADLPKITIIYDGQCNPIYRVDPGIWHKFRALTDVKCIEIYNFKYDGEDIERRTVGSLETKK